MAPYAKPIMWRSVLDIMTSVVPFFVGWALMYVALDVSYWLVLAISRVPTAGFLLRTFIPFHDCTHGSFFESKRASTWGGRFFGLLVFSASAAGAITTRSTTAPPVTSTGAVTATSPLGPSRSTSPSPSCRASDTGSSATP